jgi:hypothetical protein
MCWTIGGRSVTRAGPNGITVCWRHLPIAYAVGGGEMIYKTTNGGASWTQQSAAATELSRRSRPPIPSRVGASGQSMTRSRPTSSHSYPDLSADSRDERDARQVAARGFDRARSRAPSQVCVFRSSRIQIPPPAPCLALNPRNVTFRGFFVSRISDASPRPPSSAGWRLAERDARATVTSISTTCRSRSFAQSPSPALARTAGRISSGSSPRACHLRERSNA